MGLGEGIRFFLQNVVPQPLGEIWENGEATDAFDHGTLRSRGGGKRLRVAFRNLSSVPVLLCWISEGGDLRHFYKLSPYSGHQTYLLNAATIVEGDHVETTFGGHAFCIADVPEDEISETKKLKRLPETSGRAMGSRDVGSKNDGCEGGSIRSG